MRDERTMFAITLVLICVLAASLGQVILKQGMSSIDKINNVNDLVKFKAIINILTNKYVILGVILYGLVFILWMAAMSTLDISFMYPMLSLAYLITTAMAFLFLGENISMIRWIGTVLVVAGCLLISRS